MDNDLAQTLLDEIKLPSVAGPELPPQGETELRYGEPDFSPLPLDQGADIRDRDKSGRTALQLSEDSEYDNQVGWAGASTTRRSRIGKWEGADGTATGGSGRIFAQDMDIQGAQCATPRCGRGLI